MSVFYDLASLVLVPSGYKASKVYAQKPLTADGQLTFSRASTATRVNASGLVETVSSNVPRLDYLGSTCPKLQLEPQRVNLALYSSELDNAAWTKYEATITANAGTSPDGSVNADKFLDSANNDTHALYAGYAISGDTTFSIFVKSAEYTRFAALNLSDGGQVIYNLSTESVVSTSANYKNAKIENYGNGWYRVSATTNGVSGSKAMGWALVNNAGATTFSGTETSGVFVYGAQVEAGAYATSYIPTTSAAVTRLADAASKTGISSLIGQTEGTLFVDLTEVNDLDFPEITIDNNNNTDRIALTRSSSGNWGIFVASSTASTYSVYSTISSTSGKFALAYSSAGYTLYRNGVQIVTGTYDLPTALSAVQLNGRSTSDFFATKKVAQALLFKTRLTNAQLAEITQL